MMERRVRVRTPSRLHFGLLGWGPESRRQFGGLGLMIQSPWIELVAERADECVQQLDGPLMGRAAVLLVRLQARLSAMGIQPVPIHMSILAAPDEHVGLGVGTQLSLAVTSAAILLAGAAEPGIEKLAELTGRGDRSGIGLHGFHGGGLIVDGGRKQETGIPLLIARHPFPEEWSILVIQPPGQHGLHGADERRAFDGLPSIPRQVTDRLCRLVLLELIPAVLEHDLPSFGAALMELQAHVGAVFSPAQGGIYASPEADAIIEELGRSGFFGMGQSSWGPTLYAFSDRPPEEINALAARLRLQPLIRDCSVLVTRADNQGALRIVEY
jgi:beta-ribofuranosylaminobenzene 5'-phosphate synthase